MKLECQITPHTKINSRWIKDLNISHNTIKDIEGSGSRKISAIPSVNIFTDIFPRARDIKERTNKWVFLKIKNFSTAKENISKMKRGPTIWENVFSNDTLDKGLISKYIKNSHNSTPGRQTTQLKNGQRS